MNKDVKLRQNNYGAVRLPTNVHVGRTATGLLRPARRYLSGGRLWGLPVPVQRVSTHAQGLRLRGVRTGRAFTVLSDVAFRIR